MNRSRTITWQDPLETFGQAAGLSGLDYLLAMGEGRLPKPPIMELIGFEAVDASEGRVVFAVEPAEYHYNPIGIVHGALAMTLLDSAMGCAVQSTLPAGEAYSSLEVKINFARAITRDTGRVTCEGTVLNRGRTIALADGRVTQDSTGKLLAHGSTTCMIMAPNR